MSSLAAAQAAFKASKAASILGKSLAV